jgi:hypothetical protein
VQGSLIAHIVRIRFLNLGSGLLFFQHDLLQLAQSFGVVQKVVMLRAKNQVCADNWRAALLY